MPFGTPTRSSAASVAPPVGVDQRAHRLLDEERVAPGLLVQPADEPGRGLGAEPVGDERAVASRSRPGELEPLVAALAAQAAQEIGQSRAAVGAPAAGTWR